MTTSSTSSVPFFKKGVSQKHSKWLMDYETKRKRVKSPLRISLLSQPKSGRQDSEDTFLDKKLQVATAAYKQIYRKDLLILDEIGIGQNGTVLKALHLSDYNVLALKKVDISKKDLKIQLLQELEAFSTNSCNHLISLYGVYVDEDAITLALEFMNRNSLRFLLKWKGCFPENVIRHIVYQVLKALEYLHERKQIHRDIKPDNILIDNQGNVKLSDFGLLTTLHKKKEMCNDLVGTISYLSPERAQGQSYSYPSDIWSLGITVLMLLTGKNPLSPNASIWDVVDFAEKPIPRLPDTCSPSLRSFVAQCLVKNPVARLTARQLLVHPFIYGKKHAQVDLNYFALPLTTTGEEISKISNVIVKRLDPTEDDLRYVAHLAHQLGISPEPLRLALEMKLIQDGPLSPKLLAGPPPSPRSFPQLDIKFRMTSPATSTSYASSNSPLSSFSPFSPLPFSPFPKENSKCFTPPPPIHQVRLGFQRLSTSQMSPLKEAEENETS